MSIYPILAEHLSRYPKMTVQDAVKLLYQGLLGTGHSALSFEAALQYIEEERKNLPLNANQPFFEAIGYNRYRLALNVPKAPLLSSQTIARLFISQREDNQNLAAFKLAIQELTLLIESKELPLPAESSLAFLANYARRNYPSVHHSEPYRTQYQPHYRVVGWEGSFYQTLLTTLDEKINSSTPSVPFVLAIDGRCSSGKTSLAAWLHALYPQSQVIPMDDFFLPLQMKTARRLSLPGGNVHHERVLNEVLLPIKNHTKGGYRPFDCQSQTFKKEVFLTSSPLYILEGSYSLYPTLQPFYDYSIFLTLPYKRQKERILARNGPHMITRFIDEWIPLEEAYFSHFKVEAHADYLKDTSMIPF